jgi:CheY-like chemotaxis protein
MIKVIFLVDDDQDDREIFKEALTECDPDIEFLFASDGFEALNRLGTLKDVPDVIFVDNYMPRMNGIDCLKALKINAKTRLVPTVIYSASADSEKKKILLLSGADHFLEKRSTFSDLCADLRAILEIIKDTLRSRAV